MARIRTVKPELFRHRDLFLAEKRSGLPLRTAFAALFCCADREGRFKWQPEELKLDCLPWDDVDFEAVLNALVHAGFIEKYRVDTRDYAWIPGFSRHQHVNPKEAKSVLPSPEGSERVPTRENLECRGREGELEGERKGRELSSGDPAGAPVDEDPPGRAKDPPQKREPSQRYDDVAWRRKVGADTQELIDTLRREVMRASPEAIFRAPEKQEAIAGNRLVGLCRSGKLTRERLLFLLHAVPPSDFWRGKCFSLTVVERNLSQMLAQTERDWSTCKDDPDPLAVFKWQQ